MSAYLTSMTFALSQRLLFCIGSLELNQTLRKDRQMMRKYNGLMFMNMIHDPVKLIRKADISDNP